MTTTTLCYIENDNKYLMLHRVKKKNDMNEGKWIGVGGHVESQETPEECLVREVKEETGLTLTSYKFRGLVTFINSECESELMCVFTADGLNAMRVSFAGSTKPGYRNFLHGKGIKCFLICFFRAKNVFSL